MQQCLALCLVLHQRARGRDGGVGLARLERVLMSESLDDHVEVNMLAQQLSRRDDGLEVDHV
jgi:hypothetical protein